MRQKVINFIYANAKTDTLGYKGFSWVNGVECSLLSQVELGGQLQ